MKITANEIKALQAIVNSEYQNDKSDPVGYDVWTKYVNPFKSKKTLSGVYSSLSQKGAIQVGFLEDGQGRNQMGTVNITQAGYDAFKRSQA